MAAPEQPRIDTEPQEVPEKVFEFISGGGEAPELSTAEQRQVANFYMDVTARDRERWDALGEEAQSRFRLIAGVETLEPGQRSRGSRQWRNTSPRRAPQRGADRLAMGRRKGERKTSGGLPVSARHKKKKLNSQGPTIREVR